MLRRVAMATGDDETRHGDVPGVQSTYFASYVPGAPTNEHGQSGSKIRRTHNRRRELRSHTRLTDVRRHA